MFYAPIVQDWIARLKHITQALVNAILTPPTVTVTAAVTGSTHYSYVVVAKTGADVIPTLASITNGNAAMSAIDFNTITWSPLAGDDLSPVTYDVWRTVGGTTQGLIASGLSGVYSLVDSGLAAVAGTAPVRNTTGTVVGNTQQNNIGLITATGASVLLPQPGSYLITASGAATPTLALPVAGGPGVGDDGVVIKVTALTAHAHTITTPAGGINNASTTLTFAAVGDQAILEAYNGYWVTNGVVTAAHIS